MRDEISVLAGPRDWRDTRLSWLAKVPRAVQRLLGTEKETVSFRMVKSLWYGAITDPEHHAARDLRRAAELVKARPDALHLVKQYQQAVGSLDAGSKDVFRGEIARLERVARMLRGDDRTGS